MKKKKNIHTQNQYSARIKGVKSTVFSFLLNKAIPETLTISNGRLFQISIILFAKLYRETQHVNRALC